MPFLSTLKTAPASTSTLASSTTSIPAWPCVVTLHPSSKLGAAIHFINCLPCLIHLLVGDKGEGEVVPVPHKDVSDTAVVLEVSAQVIAGHVWTQSVHINFWFLITHFICLIW